MMTFQVRLKKVRKPNQPRLRFDLEELRDPDMACTFQATIGGKFAPLIGLSDEDMDIDTMITTYNTAVTDAASEILQQEDLQPILREEVEIAVASLKKGKSSGVDNIPAELVQGGGETMIDVLTGICNRIWRTGEWPTPWTQSLIITPPKKGNLQLCQNYRTISLISYSSKVMLEVILNRLKPRAEEIIAEEQAGLRARRSPTEQIFNLRILCEKYLQHQQNLYHV